MNIIFVCTGNTCRSPMAEAAAKELIPNHSFSSFGIMAYEGAPMSANADYALSLKNIPHGFHSAKNISREDIDKADIILTMSAKHKAALEPYGKDRVFTLKEYCLGKNEDIADPFGGDEEAYVKCLEEIIECITALKEKLPGLQKGEVKMIAVGCDQGGYELKCEIIKHLEEKGLEFKDYGTYSPKSTDYPVYAKKVAEAVAAGEAEKGILVCGTGIGVSIAANKVKGIRCALCGDVFSAKATRAHNDSNILALGGRVVGAGLALEIVDAWLNTEFSHEERHQRRIDLISDMEK